MFSNVKSGLVPSVDVFLESTQSFVQILKTHKPIPDKEE